MKIKAEKIVATMPEDERATLSLGFYNYDGYIQRELDKEMDSDYEHFVPHGWSSPQPWGQYDVNSEYYDYDEFTDDSEEFLLDTKPKSPYLRSNFTHGDTSIDSRGSVNGAWGRLHSYGRTDNFTDEEYEYFLTKKSRARRKKRKSLRKSGLSRGAARVEARKQIPRDSLKTIAKKSFKRLGSNIKKVGKVIKSGVFFIPRQSYRLLMTLNFRGMAARLTWIKKNDKSLWNKVAGKWKGIGGKVSSLEKSINKGKGKKMLFCFRKCKAKHNAKYVKKNFSGAGGIVIDKDALYSDINESMGYSNVEPVTTATAAAMAAASSIIVMIGNQIGKAGETKAMKQETERQAKRDDKELEIMAEQQGINKEQMKQKLDSEEKAIMAELDPVNQIMQNPDLSPAEKAAAVKEVKAALETKGKGNLKKYALIGGIALVAIVVLAKAFKK